MQKANKMLAGLSESPAKREALEALSQAYERIEELEEWVNGAIPWVNERDIKSYGRKLLSKKGTRKSTLRK